MTTPRGCAGVALSGALAEHFAPLAAEPITSAVVTEVAGGLGDAAAGPMEALWDLDVEPAVRWELARTGAGVLVFSINGAPALLADPAGATLRLGRHPVAVAAQLVAAVGAPALAAANGAVPVHGACVARDGDGATLIVGQSGAGKSSLLSALTDAGWQPVSEDVTVVDVAGDGSTRAWPGPPWVRLAPGQLGPHGSEPRPDATDKVCWDLTGRQPDGPVPLRRIVVLEPPGGSAPGLQPVPPDEAIAVLPPHITWLSTQPRGTAAFAGAVALSRRVRVMRLRMPRHADWARQAGQLFAAL